MRQIVRFFLVVVGAIVLLYVGDWGVFEVRVAHGIAYSAVQVDQFLATSLKGDKTEYDLMGTLQETCTRSIFPQQWHLPAGG